MHKKENSSKFDIKRNYVLIILLSVLFILVFVGDIQSAIQEADYNEEAKTDFLSTCVNAGGNKNYCECFYNEVQKRYIIRSQFHMGYRMVSFKTRKKWLISAQIRTIKSYEFKMDLHYFRRDAFNINPLWLALWILSAITNSNIFNFYNGCMGIL